MSNNMLFYGTSIKNGTNINNGFDELLRFIYIKKRYFGLQKQKKPQQKQKKTRTKTQNN